MALFSPGLTFPVPGGGGDLGRIFDRGIISPPQPIQTGRPRIIGAASGGGDKVGVNWGGAGSGAASGAATGTMVNPGWGTAIGGVIGGIAGLFQPKAKEGMAAPSTASTSAGMPGLSDALSLGLGGLFTGKPQPINVTQTQNVEQATSVNVNTILGREFAGGVSGAGDFDLFKAIGDVFTLRDALATSGTTGGGAAAVRASGVQAEGTNLMPLILLGGAGVLAFLLMKGKK